MTTLRPLRPYQSEQLTAARRMAGKGFTRILIQLPTGTGKTRMISAAINNAISKPSSSHSGVQRVWFVVPRKELLWQTSAEFSAWNIKHGMISASSDESSAFQVHICSRDTLKRRITAGKIKKWPDIIMIDEAHLALDNQLFLIKSAPAGTLFLGLTATPERLDGRGLNEAWEVLVNGEPLQYFVELGYLKRPWVLSIPPAQRVEGLDELKFNRSGDVKTGVIESLFTTAALKRGKNRIYGDAIEHYQKYGIDKTGRRRAVLIFCRSIKQAEDVAKEFTDAGISCESIDGGMTDKVRKDKISRVSDGRLTGLTTVDLCTYGLDVPKISCLIMLRPTQSVALYFQMIGRGLRPDDEYENCLILDHVGNCDDTNHGHPLAPREWNFSGTITRKKCPKNAVKPVASVNKCPICWDLMMDVEQDGQNVRVCRSCGYIDTETGVRKPLKQVDGWLVEINEPTPLKERPPEQRREYADMIAANIATFRQEWNEHGTINRASVENLIEVAHDLKWKNGVKQVYYRLVPETEMVINVSLLRVIAEIKGYNPYWIKRFRMELEKRGLNRSA